MQVVKLALVILVTAVVVLAPAVASADCDVSWDGGGGTDRRWWTGTNWTGNLPPDADDDVCHLIGGTIELDDDVEINSFTIGGTTDGGLTIDGGLELVIADDFNVEFGFNATYDIVVGEDAHVDVTGTIGNGTFWTVNDGALVECNSIGGLDQPPAASELPDICASLWTINDGQVNVDFGEGAICWQVSGGDGPLGEEIFSTRKIVARRLYMDNGAELNIGDQTLLYGILQGAGGETVLDNSTITAIDLKTKVLEGVPLATTTLKNASTIEIQEMVGDGNNAIVRPSMGALFYGAGNNLFLSHADALIFRNTQSFDGYASSIIAPDPRGASNPTLSLQIGGDLLINSRTDLDFDYLVNVGDDPDEVSASWDSSGVSLAVLAGTQQVHTESDIEIVNVDFGGIWFCDNERMKAWESFTVSDYADAALVNASTNQFHGTGSGRLPYPYEAMYVDGDVLIATHGTLDMNSKHLYMPPSATLQVNGSVTDGSITVIQSKTCYGDFDNDFDVDLDDRNVFCDAYSGSGNPTVNVLADYDLDGDVDDDDQEAFADNFNGANHDPRCICFAGPAAQTYDAAPSPLCP